MNPKKTTRTSLPRPALTLEHLENRLVPAANLFENQLSDLYQLGLHRSPDSDGHAHFQSLLEQGTPLNQVARSIFQSNEFHERVLAQFYQYVLRREPDALGFKNHLDAANHGVQLDKILAGFFSSKEFSGAMDNQEYVQALYKTILDRTPDAQGLETHVKALDQGTSRFDLADSFLESSEFSGKIADALYRHILNRAPSEQERLHWISQFSRPEYDFVDGLTSFTSSPEGSQLLGDSGAPLQPLDESGFGAQASLFGLGASLASASPTGTNDQAAEVGKLINQIRAIETFSNPTNPGQVVSALSPDHFPNPDAINDPNAKTTGTQGLDAYPGDGRNTPGAFQIDLANLNNAFGIWKGTAGSAKGASIYDTQFAFSKQALETYFGILVDSNGLITQIPSAAASVLLHNESVALDTFWNPSSNPLIGQHIDNYQSEQLSLSLAGRLAKDSNVVMANDPRTAPDPIIAADALIQGQAAKNFIWSSYDKYKTFADYKDIYAKAEALFGSTLQITASSSAFGITKGQAFLCEFNPGFIIGGGYVRGFNTGGMFDIIKAVVEADQAGQSSYVDAATQVTINITKTTNLGVKTFSFDKTPINVNENYPSIYHYGAIVSSFAVDMTNSADWNIATDPFAMGYSQTQTKVDINNTATLPTGNGPYAITYSGLENLKTLTVQGPDTYHIGVVESQSAQNVVVDNSGYPNTDNNSQNVGPGQVIDMSAYNTTMADAYPNFFYVYTETVQGTPVDKLLHVSDPAVPGNLQLRMYYIPAANGSVSDAQAAINQGDFSTFSKYHQSYRVLVSNLSVLGRPTSANDWATHFIMTPPPPPPAGTGVIDASGATGSLSIETDQSLATVKLGSDYNTVIGNSKGSGVNYILNPSMAPATTATVLTGLNPAKDFIDLSPFTQVANLKVTFQATYDNNAGASTATKTLYKEFTNSALVTFNAESSGVPNTYQFLVLLAGNTQLPPTEVESQIQALIVT